VTDEHERRRDRERVDTGHLDGVADGCGCAEVWEHLSEDREADADREVEAEAETETGTRTGNGEGDGATVADAG